MRKAKEDQKIKEIKTDFWFFQKISKFKKVNKIINYNGENRSVFGDQIVEQFDGIQRQPAYLPGLS